MFQFEHIMRHLDKTKNAVNTNVTGTEVQITGFG
jgi:hypothetical protein